MIRKLENNLEGSWLVVLCVILFNLLCVVYYPALRGPFVFDDLPGIVENEDLRHPGQPWLVFRDHEKSVEFDRRPVTALTFVANYALGGLNPLSYRLINIALHLLTGTLLAYAITLVARRFGCEVPRVLGWAVAIMWLFHPLATSAVSYIYQRSEILMALFFLAAIVAVLRAGDGTNSRRWLGLAFAAAVLSALSKEPGLTLLVALPVVERISSFPTWRDWFRRRRRFYCALALTFGVITIWIAGGVRVGELDDGGVLATPLGYFQTQCRVLVRYLALVFWPHPLIFFPQPKHVIGLAQWIPHFLFLCLLFGTGLLSGMKTRWLLLPVALFLIILAPTSSFLPIPLEPEVEFRMYLPSALVIAVVVVIAGSWLRGQWGGRLIGGTILAVAVVAAGGASMIRNRDYASAERLWWSVVEHDPVNSKAWNNLGVAALASGDFELTRICATRLIQLGSAYNDPTTTTDGKRFLALWQIEKGDPKEALQTLTAMASDPAGAPASMNLDLALAETRNGNHLRALDLADKEVGPQRRLPRDVVRSEAMLGLGRLGEARSVHLQLAAEFPDDWWVRQLARRIAEAEEGATPAAKSDGS